MDDVLVASELAQALRRSIQEEVDALRALVDDEDADCIARGLRAERLAAFEHVIRLIETAERWEW